MTRCIYLTSGKNATVCPSGPPQACTKLLEGVEWEIYAHVYFNLGTLYCDFKGSVCFALEIDNWARKTDILVQSLGGVGEQLLDNL